MTAIAKSIEDSPATLTELRTAIEALTKRVSALEIRTNG